MLQDVVAALVYSGQHPRVVDVVDILHLVDHARSDLPDWLDCLRGSF